MIQVPMTPDQFDAAAKRLSDEEGVQLTGRQGAVNKHGVTVGYAFDGKALQLTVLHKPMMLTVGFCESKMRGWLGV